MAPRIRQDFGQPREAIFAENPDVLVEALEWLRQNTAPAPDEWLIAAIAETSLMCRSIDKDGEDVTDAKLRGYVARLRRFPGDVALRVLREWPDKNSWFPVWNELNKACEAAAARRKALEHLLEWTIANRRRRVA